MSEEKKIEKLFGDALKKFGAPPPDDLKNDIANQLKQKGFIKEDANRKGYFRWFGAIALLVAVVASVYFLNENKSADNKNVTEQHQQTTTETNASYQNTISQSVENKLSSNNDKIEETNSTPAIILQKNENDKNSTNETSTPTNNKVPSRDKKVPESNDITKNANSTKTKTKKSFPGNMIAETSTASVIHENKKKTHKQKNQISNAQKNDNGKMSNENDERNKANDVIKNANLKADSLPEANENATTGNESDLSNSKQNDSIANAQSQALAEAEKTAQQKNDSIAKALEEQHQKAVQDSIAKSQTKKSKFITGISIDVFASPVWTTSKFSSSESKYDSLTSELKNSETEETSYSFGAGVNLAHNNILLQPGINYSMLKSAFDYVNTQTNLDSSNSYWGNYVDSMYLWYDSLNQVWDTITVHIDSSYISVIDTLQTTVKTNASNQVSVLEIPLLFGYRFTEGKFDFEIRAGVSIGFVTGASGATYSPSTNELITYNNVSNSPYRKSYWNFMANIYAVYNLNDRFAFFLQPAAKIGLSSVYKSDYPVSKNLKQYSIGVGMRFKF